VKRVKLAPLEIKPRVIAGGERAFGPGKADLLDHIASTGSISAAAKAMEMSYSRAWQLVDQMNRAFKRPLVEAATGGKRGGGAVLTEEGAEVLALYRRLERDLTAIAAPMNAAFAKRLR
jgi:molybdate transport system regulatory protein